MIDMVISVVSLVAAVAGQQSSPMTPIAVRASNGIWIGLRNNAKHAVEICDFSASVQGVGQTGSEGRISGGVIPFCEHPVANILLQPQQAYFIWLDTAVRGRKHWTFSIRAALVESAPGGIRDTGFVWHEWEPLQLKPTPQSAAAWRVERLGYHGVDWIVVRNVSNSPRAVSVEQRVAPPSCSRVSDFHLVLPGESLVQARDNMPGSLAIFEADVKTGKCLGDDGLQISPAVPK